MSKHTGYRVCFLPSGKLMMIAPLETIAVVLGLHQSAVDRIVQEEKCILYGTKPHGTVAVSPLRIGEEFIIGGCL